MLYFYPKDDTPGCTKEAQGFAAAYPEFQAAGVEVVGVSKDSAASHDQFKAKYGLPFPLASDEPGGVVEAYGSWVEKSMYGKKYMGIDRSTFLIDAERQGASGLAQRQGAGPCRGGAGRGTGAAGRMSRDHTAADRAAPPAISWPARCASIRRSGSCATTPRACPGRACRSPRAGSVHGVAGRADRRAPRARDRLLHRLQRARHGAGPAAGRPPRHARGQRRTESRSAGAPGARPASPSGSRSASASRSTASMRCSRRARPTPSTSPSSTPTRRATTPTTSARSGWCARAA